MQAGIVNPFLTATIDLLNTMCNIKAVPCSPHIVNGFGNHRWEISGVISFIGEHIGVIVIRLPEYVARKLLERTGMFPEKEEDIPEMIYQMVGEFSNIIAGNAIGPLTEQGLDLTISPPIVVTGRNHSIHWPQKAPIIGLPFRTEIGPFSVDLSMKQFVGLAAGLERSA